MIASPGQTHIAYICPECGQAIYGFIGKFALSANMLRIKCSCGHSAMEITLNSDNKVRISAPCVFCKQNHNFVVSQSLFFSRDLFLLNCPYSNMDICFIGEKDKTDKELLRVSGEIENLINMLEAESIKDIQPEDLEEDEVLPDPTLYDAIRFLIRELEVDGNIDCPCHKGEYELRFVKEGIEVFCSDCNATYLFNLTSPSASEDYIKLSSILLT